MAQGDAQSHFDKATEAIEGSILPNSIRRHGEMLESDFLIKRSTGPGEPAANGSAGLPTQRELISLGRNGWSDEPITGTRIMKMIERQGFRCAVTGRTLTPKTASLDHIVPLKDGGDNNMGNVQIVHADANAAKGTMSMERFVALCRDVAAWLGQ